MIALVGTTLLAAVLVTCSFMVARTNNLVHAVFWLAATLVATAALLVVLSAPFLAAIQVLLYAGGVITLMLFGVMLTHRDPDTEVPNPAHRAAPAAVTAATLLAVLLAAVWTTPELAAMQPTAPASAADVGRAFLGPHLLAFEVLSVLLLTAMIGAIVLARKVDP